MKLTEEEFATLDESLNNLKVFGHRGLGGFLDEIDCRDLFPGKDEWERVLVFKIDKN